MIRRCLILLFVTATLHGCHSTPRTSQAEVDVQLVSLEVSELLAGMERVQIVFTVQNNGSSPVDLEPASDTFRSVDATGAASEGQIERVPVGATRRFEMIVERPSLGVELARRP